MQEIKLYTIGSNKKSAEEFITTLKNAGISRLIDIRILANSQLFGFATEKTLKYILPEYLDIKYERWIDFAPPEDLFKAYKKNKTVDGKQYGVIYRKHIQNLGTTIDNFIKSGLNGICLLCIEESPLNCHRRILAEYLKEKVPEIQVIHL